MCVLAAIRLLALVFLLARLVVLLVRRVVFAYGKWRVSSIRSHSQKYRRLLEVNERYRFESVCDIRYTHRCRSKQEFGKFNFEECFQKKVNRDISLMTDKLDAAQRNKTKQEACLRDRSLLPESKYKRKSWVEAEAMLCQQSKLKPSCDFKVYVKVEHASPQGRNHYEREWPFGSGRILPTWNYVQKRMREKQARQAEIRRGRAKVTPKLRYEILKRDGCRCQICGSEQSDGVKLHVDHIKPVSKGGKTTRDNLRTLCDRCNQGKGNEV